MKIAIFTETYLPYINGVVTHVKALKDGLEKLGNQVLIVTADVDAKHHYTKEGILHCPAKYSKKFYGYGLAAPLSSNRLRLLREFDPDVIHIHQEFGIGFSGMIAARKLNKPLVYTLHTMYDDYLYYVAPRPFIPLMKRISHRYAHFLATKSAALTGPSKKVEEFFRECGIDKDVNVVPNPVELDMFDPEKVSAEQKHAFREKFGIAEDEMLACFCGRLGKEKSVDVLLNYWAETYRPEDNMKLFIIGEGPAKDDLMDQANSLNIKDSVVFAGKVMHPDLPPYYACCDCYVTASLSDTNSISMLEGMAMGLPVLQLYDELNKDQVVEGVNGFVFTDAESLHEKLLKIRDMPQAEMDSLRASVRESVKKSGAETLARHLLSIYKKSLRDFDPQSKPRKTGKVYRRKISE